MGRLLYNVVLHAVGAPALLAVYGPSVVLRDKYRRSLRGKLGVFPSDFPQEPPHPRVWFHAVSVGEVTALAPIVRSFARRCPKGSLIVSTGTETGQDAARSLIPEADGFLYMPLDFPIFVNRTVRRISPDLFVLMETELWPNLLHVLKKRGTLLALANGRISDRSFPRYRRLRRALAPMLNDIDLFLMSSDLDVERIREMGAPPERTHNVGNTKLDAAFGDLSPEPGRRLRVLLDIPEGTPVLVAGSTHPGEHEAIIEAHRALTREFPDLLLILAPRHVERVSFAVDALQRAGFSRPFLRSSADEGFRRGDAKVVIMDKTGELLHLYSLASAAFVGGSLVPQGGQNILEPAAWGKVVVFGPSMEDFRDARDMLVKEGAGIQAKDAAEIAAIVSALLRDPTGARERGERGRRAISRAAGASERTVSRLLELLGVSRSSLPEDAVDKDASPRLHSAFTH